ncbi:MAG: hypothetical protein IIY01_02945, partial [Clostridia bacterium]|nr:hypothetical protein [Clostridia bacterium]
RSAVLQRFIHSVLLPNRLKALPAQYMQRKEFTWLSALTFPELSAKKKAPPFGKTRRTAFSLYL